MRVEFIIWIFRNHWELLGALICIPDLVVDVLQMPVDRFLLVVTLLMSLRGTHGREKFRVIRMYCTWTRNGEVKM